MNIDEFNNKFGQSIFYGQISAHFCGATLNLRRTAWRKKLKLLQFVPLDISKSIDFASSTRSKMLSSQAIDTIFCVLLFAVGLWLNAI